MILLTIPQKNLIYPPPPTNLCKPPPIILQMNFFFDLPIKESNWPPTNLYIPHNIRTFCPPPVQRFLPFPQNKTWVFRFRHTPLHTGKKRIDSKNVGQVQYWDVMWHLKAKIIIWLIQDVLSIYKESCTTFLCWKGNIWLMWYVVKWYIIQELNTFISLSTLFACKPLIELAWQKRTIKDKLGNILV